MKQEVVILEAEDEEGHADLIRRNLSRAGITNKLLLFKDGQEISDFLFRNGDGPHREPGIRYVLLLDCLLYTSPSPRDRTRSRMPSSA